MRYNYFEAVCDDVCKEIAESWADRFADFETLDELREALNNELWTCDRVTGNASGSYTFSTWQAKEYLADNWDVFEEACAEFGVDIAKEVKKGAESVDVLIRCYFFGAAIDKVLPYFEEYFNAVHEEARG
jgi:hypothetical protein